MPAILHAFLTWVLYPLLTVLLLVLLHAVSGLAQLMIKQYFSPLGELSCPPIPSFFWGHLQLLHDAENSNLYMKWMEQLGTVFTYRGFIGGHRLVTMDTRAITHILSRPSEYPKPGFVRDTLASMAGEYGLLVVEGETHKRQRKILSPSFTAPQVRELTPIFYDKAIKLCDIWLAHIDNPSLASTKLAEQVVPYSTKSKPKKRPHETLLSPATPTLPLIPSPRLPTPPSTFRSRSVSPQSPSHNSIFARAQSIAPHPPTACGTHVERSLDSRGGEPGSSGEEARNFVIDIPPSPHIIDSRVRIDVLNWLGRATLDVIGLAGFGYAFDSLVDDKNVLAAAFAEVFTAARKFRFITVLQAWFPILGYFRDNRKSRDRSLRTMHQIGMDLINRAHERLTVSPHVPVEIDFRKTNGRIPSDEEEESDAFPLEDDEVLRKGKGPLKGRDLLSLLIKSNVATADRDRMSQDEILSQISTFMAAGHESTSSALTWALYALSQNPACQSRLRAEVSAVPTSTPSLETLNALPYLDLVVRESLRLYSPVSQTMREAKNDDIIPVAAPYRDAKGRTRSEIRIRRGDIISIPIQAMNKCKKIFGEDAEKFIPERWERPPSPNAMPTLYSSILTFLCGGRACIGYRFALAEMKIFLFVLLRSVRFESCPGLVIEKRLNVVTRPLVKSEPERGNQMPLLLSRVTSPAPPLATPPL